MLLACNGVCSGPGIACDHSCEPNAGLLSRRELAAELEAGVPLYRSAFGTARPGGWQANALDIQLKNPANINVLLWGAVPHTRLLALWEVCPEGIGFRV